MTVFFQVASDSLEWLLPQGDLPVSTRAGLSILDAGSSGGWERSWELAAEAEAAALCSMLPCSGQRTITELVNETQPSPSHSTGAQLAHAAVTE